MTELLQGWAWTSLGEIGEYLNGRGFRKHEWSDSGRPIIRIQNLTGTSQRFNHFDGEADELYIARRGDLLISWAATLGAYVWDGPEAVVNQHIFKVKSFIDTRFHRYLVTSVLDELQRRAHGSGMVHVTRKVFDETPVALPPLAEQRRIVAAIEGHLSRLDAAVASLRAAAARADVMIAAATARALTTEWPIVKLREVTKKQEYGSGARAGREGDVVVLRMGNVRDGDVDLSDLKYLPAEHPDAIRFRVAPGDLLFNRTNSPELVGKSAVFKGADYPVAFASYLIRVQLTEDCLPDWAALVINSSLGRSYVARVRTQQVGQANVNGTKLKAMPIPLPPLDTQRALLAEVDANRQRARRLAAAIGAAVQRSDSLRRSILACAFRGELVPQDSADEPASVLLEQVAGERAASPKAMKKRRKRASA